MAQCKEKCDKTVMYTNYAGVVGCALRCIKIKRWHRLAQALDPRPTSGLFYNPTTSSSNSLPLIRFLRPSLKIVSHHKALAPWSYFLSATVSFQVGGGFNLSVERTTKVAEFIEEVEEALEESSLIALSCRALTMPG